MARIIEADDVGVKGWRFHGADQAAGSPGALAADIMDVGPGNDEIVGTPQADDIDALEGDDIISGMGGADVISGGDGGAGNDAYYIDDAGDIAFESAGEGTDTVLASVTYTLRANFEDLVLIGGAIHGVGNALGNRIDGSDDANIIDGGAGNDVLIGHGGDDSLIGGAGDDAFVFTVGSGQDVVSGFVAGGVEDTIDLSAYDGSGVTWSVDQIGADTVFSFSNGDSITLVNVIAANLVQDDAFHYS